MPATLTKSGDLLELNLSGLRGGAFQEAKEKIRDVPGRRWDPQTKNWVVPADARAADRILKTIRPEASDELVAWIRSEMSSGEDSLTTPLREDAALLLPWATERMPWQPEVVNDENFDGALPGQRAAIDAMANWRRAILADDMGLGKTLEAIGAVEEWQLRNPAPDGTLQDGPKLVVAPSSVKGGWLRELRRWLPPETPVHVIDGSYTKTKLVTGEQRRAEAISHAIEEDAWVIVNWEQLRVQKTKIKTRNGGSRTVKAMKEPLFESTDWLAVIADEAHRAKNRESQQTKGLWRCQGKLMYALTGTPIMNSPDEMWSLLRWLWPEEYHERGAAYSPGAVAYWPFYDTHVDYYEDHFGRKVITGVKNADALRFVLKGKLIRRLAPAGGRKRIYYSVPLNPKQRKLYDDAEKAMWLAISKEVSEGNKQAIEFAQAATAEGDDFARLLRIPNGAARLVRLQQIIENAALLGGDDDSAQMDDFEQKFADSRPYQWVVFCKYKESCSILAERLRKRHGDSVTVGVYTGDTLAADRTSMEDRFQGGEVDVMIGTIGAMKEGITLTASHLTYFMTRDFVPDVNEQCESRCDRMGQQHKVVVYIPQAESTVATSKVEAINRLKESIVRAVLPKVKIEEGSI